MGKGARSWRWRKGTTTAAEASERGSEQCRAGAREQLLEAAWESCWALGTGLAGVQRGSGARLTET